MSDTDKTITALLSMGEAKSELKREVADLEDRKNILNKDILHLEKEKGAVLSAESLELKNQQSAFKKECSAREKDLSAKEADISKRLEASSVIADQEKALKNKRSQLKEEEKNLQAIKSSILEKDHLANLKQEQLDLKLIDLNLSPEEIEKKAKAKKVKVKETK